MVRLRQGDHIYSAGAQRGFDAATYGPVYYLLGSHLVNPSHPSYLPLRLLSLIGILGCATGCGLLAFWLSGSYLAAVLAPLIFLSYGMATDHGVSALSDAVALFLCFAGFLVAYRFRCSKAILYAVPLMLLGFYYKPQYIAGSLAVFAFLLLEKRYQRATEFAGLTVLGGLGMFAFFQFVAFGGQAFWRHFLMYQTSLLSSQRFGIAMFVFACMLVIPLVLVLDFLRVYPNKLMACYLACAVLLGVFTASKEGSGVHYFFESALLISAVVPALLAKRFAKRVDAADVVALLAIGLWAGHWFAAPGPKLADFAECGAVQSYLSENVPRGAVALGFEPGTLIQAGLETPFSSLFQLVQLSHHRKISDSGLVARVRARTFAVIVLPIDAGKDRDSYWSYMYLTEHLREAIIRNYRLQTILAMPAPEKDNPRERLYIYVPKPRRAVASGGRQAVSRPAEPEAA